MSDWWILGEDGTPRRARNFLEGALWFDAASRDGRRNVARTHVGRAAVSTVFLALDHSFVGGPPLLYETMIFGGKYDQHMWRAHTRTEA